MFLGLVNGALITFLNVPPFIVTLGSLTALRGVAFLVAKGTTVINRDINFAWIGNTYVGPFPWLVIIALLSVVVEVIVISHIYWALGIGQWALGNCLMGNCLMGIRHRALGKKNYSAPHPKNSPHPPLSPSPVPLILYPLERLRRRSIITAKIITSPLTTSCQK